MAKTNGGIIYTKNILSVKKVWPLQNMNKAKSREIKGGDQEVAVMVGEWLKI